jgi:hypothetical protein
MSNRRRSTRRAAAVCATTILAGVGLGARPGPGVGNGDRWPCRGRTSIMGP